MPPKTTSKKPLINSTQADSRDESQKQKEEANKINKEQEEIGGQDGPDPTRYGDWEKGGRCSDF